MKESSLYINFFKRNLIIILVPAFICGFVALFIGFRQTTRFANSELFEIQFNQNTISERSAVVDTVVEQLRSPNLLSQLGGKGTVSVFKKSPLLIEIQVISNEKNTSEKLNGIKSYLQDTYNFKQIGILTTENLPVNYLKYIIFGFSTGFLFGIFVSLLRTYFQNF